MADNFKNSQPGLTSPGTHGAVVAPDDDANLPFHSRAIWLPAAGALRVTDVEGNTFTIPDGCLAAGVNHSIRLRKIWDTGTAAGITSVLIVE